MTVGGALGASAIGSGSAGFAGPGGNGLGGTVRLAIQGSATANFLSDLSLNATGDGGWQTQGGLAGSGTGGLIDAFVGATGGTLTVGGFANSTPVESAAMSKAQAHRRQWPWRLRTFHGAGRQRNVRRPVRRRDRKGGSTESGTGGNGTGTTARINAAGGDIAIAGTAFVNASGFGGSGTVGGNGSGGETSHQRRRSPHLRPERRHRHRRVGRSICRRYGSDGADGATAVTAPAGGRRSTPPTPTSGRVHYGPGVEASAIVSASGYGARVAAAFPALTAKAAGPAATAELAVPAVMAATVSAAGGDHRSGRQRYAQYRFCRRFRDWRRGTGGTGGNGGIGGNGDGGAGGNGGAGGAGASVAPRSAGSPRRAWRAAPPRLREATGYRQSRLCRSGGQCPGRIWRSGRKRWRVRIGSPNGTAGAGGNGGAGGAAGGGTTLLAARGGTINASFIAMTADATGGDGGIGAIDGAGGDAESDEAMVLVTNRVGNTALRGTLNAGTISGNVISTGGAAQRPAPA